MKYTKLCYEGFEKYFKFERPAFDGYQWRFEFENGFGASVVKHWCSYGSHEDLFELAVLKDGHLCYSTSITNDVIGHLKNDEVLELLEKIKTLSVINLKQGDCLELMKDIPDKSVDMILCDLPYGTTRNKWDCTIDLNLLWNQYERIIKRNGVILLFAQTPFNVVLGNSNLKMLKYEWVWKKEAGTGFLNAKKMPLKIHENILVFYKNLPTYNPQMRSGFKPYETKKGHHGTNYGSDKGATSKSNGERYPIDVIEFKRDKDKLHPTQKPVALLEYLIKTYTNEGETVLDNCMGSGSTGVACVNTNRKFIGFELDEKYFEIAKSRIENAILSGDKS